MDPLNSLAWLFHAGNGYHSHRGQSCCAPAVGARGHCTAGQDGQGEAPQRRQGRRTAATFEEATRRGAVPITITQAHQQHHVNPLQKGINALHHPGGSWQPMQSHQCTMVVHMREELAMCDFCRPRMSPLLFLSLDSGLLPMF